MTAHPCNKRHYCTFKAIFTKLATYSASGAAERFLKVARQVRGLGGQNRVASKMGFSLFWQPATRFGK